MINSMSPREAELVVCIAKRSKIKIVQVFAPTTSYSEEDINALGKPNHYKVVLGDFNAPTGKIINPMERATGKCGLELRNERGDILVEWATSRKYQIMNTMFQKKPGRRLTLKSPNEYFACHFIYPFNVEVFGVSGL